jgi:hypothetical protein
MNSWVRQFHRWLSIAFTVTVIGNFIAMGLVGSFSQSERIRARVNHPKRTPFLPPRSLRFC